MNLIYSEEDYIFNDVDKIIFNHELKSFRQLYLMIISGEFKRLDNEKLYLYIIGQNRDQKMNQILK